MEPVIKKIEIMISCRELVCARIAKLKDDIAKAEKDIIPFEKALEDARQADEKEAEKPNREKCDLCGGTGKRTKQGLFFTHEIICWRCDGKGTVWRSSKISSTPYWMMQLSERSNKLAEMKSNLKYLEDQIKNG